MDNKTKILETALELFSRKGYNGTGIQEIVSLSGVSKPTMYYYFGNKEGVLNHILESNLYNFLDEFRAITNYTGNITLTISKIMSLFFDLAISKQTFYRVFLSMSSEACDTISFKAIEPYTSNILELLVQMFKKASVEHGNMKHREREYALSFISLINGYCLYIINGSVEVTQQFVQRVSHQFMHGIFS